MALQCGTVPTGAHPSLKDINLLKYICNSLYFYIVENLFQTQGHSQESAMNAVGKLTILDFNNQEEWENHRREVGKLNIMVKFSINVKK